MVFVKYGTKKNYIRKPRLYLTPVHCIANQYYNSFQFTIHVTFIVSSIFRDYLKHSWCWILPVFCGPNINWLLLVRCAETIQFQSTHWANFVKVASRSISKRQRLLYKCIYVSFCHVYQQSSVNGKLWFQKGNNCLHCFSVFLHRLVFLRVSSPDSQGSFYLSLEWVIFQPSYLDNFFFFVCLPSQSCQASWF